MKEQKQIWFPPLVIAELDKVKNRVLKHDRDFVVVFDGEEGVGKSVLAQQWASYLDPDFNLDKIAFTSDVFIKLIKDDKTKKGSCIILDEAFSAASSRGSLTEVNKAMIAVATEMRQKNLFIIMVLPSFFDLDKYFALWRCRALVHLYFSNNESRKYLIFPKNYKKYLYLLGKKTYDYSKPSCPLPPFTFSNTYTVDETEYRDKKAEAFKKRTASHQARKWLSQRNSYIKYIYETLGISMDDIAKIPSNYGMPTLSNQQVSIISRELTDMSQ